MKRLLLLIVLNVNLFLFGQELRFSEVVYEGSEKDSSINVEVITNFELIEINADSSITVTMQPGRNVKFSLRSDGIKKGIASGDTCTIVYFQRVDQWVLKNLYKKEDYEELYKVQLKYILERDY